MKLQLKPKYFVRYLKMSNTLLKNNYKILKKIVWVAQTDIETLLDQVVLE